MNSKTHIYFLLISFMSICHANECTYSFSKSPYINPAIVELLNPWISDSEEQIMSVCLSQNRSNRFGDFKISKETGTSPTVYTKNQGSYCSYQHIGKAGKVDIIMVRQSNGGTMVSTDLFFVHIEKQMTFAISGNTLRKSVPMWILRKVGSIPLGDRYRGNITLRDNVLHIPKDMNNFSGLRTKGEWITFETE